MKASADEIALFQSLIARSKVTIDQWHSEHPIQIEKLNDLRADVAKVDDYLARADLTAGQPWDALYRWAEENLSLEGQEWIASLILEPYGALVDGYAEDMAADNTATFRIAGAMTVGDLRALLTDVYSWAIDTNWQAPENRARAWYVSEEKLEPRLGERFEEPIEEYEQPLAPGRDAAQLFNALSHWPDEAQVADFLLRHPEHRHVLRRARSLAAHPMPRSATTRSRIRCCPSTCCAASWLSLAPRSLIRVRIVGCGFACTVTRRCPPN